MIEFNETLYKKDTKDKIRTLTIKTMDGVLFQISGILNGKQVVNSSQAVPKNVGKINATTATEQAILEAQSKFKDKLTKGYFKTLKEAKNNSVTLPMLAKSYDKESHKINWSGDVFVQPKLDGMRCLAIKKNGKVKLISRKNKEITTLSHIVKQLEHKDIPDNIYDGELYSLKLGSFQEQMKAIKKIGENTEKINYHIYDIISNKPFSDRFKILENIF